MQDSENTNNQDSSYAGSSRGNNPTDPYPLQRMSMSPGAMFYQARTKSLRQRLPSQAPSLRKEDMKSLSKYEQIVQYIITMPTSMILVTILTVLLILLFFSSTYLVLRLDSIQEKMDFNISPDNSHLEKLASLKNFLHTQSSKKVQEYLDNNLEEISKVSCINVIQCILLIL